MSALYESIKSLCDERGVKPGKMCVETGISKGLITDLKMGRKKSVQVETAQKIADYFGVSVDRVLGTEQKEKPAQKGELDVAGPNMKAVLESIKDLSEAEAALVFERIQKIKESR